MTTQPNCHLLEPLTHREQHVLELMDDGLTNAEIARKLALAETTVRDYRQNIYDKLGLEGEHRKKRYALHCAHQLGLIESKTPISDLSIPALITRAKHNLPASMTKFVGRVEDIVKIQQHLKTYRLITILAPGGMGKTRLALEVARTQIDNFKDGVYFVPLQALAEPSQIAGQITLSVSMPSQGGNLKQLLLQFLGNKSMLLVIDNFEHLLDGASLLSEILQNAPDVKIIVTSRERLRLHGEKVYTLQGLQDDTLDSDAVMLLTQTAQYINENWWITEENADAVQQLIALTGSMPLAIVLAASWLDILSVEEIIIEIERGLDFLQTDMRDLPERHRSVRACFTFTWNRLTLDEQAVFMKMSVFRGGFTREAAEVVAGANLRNLQSLSNKALIRKDENGRYDVHELMRQFAEEKLDVSGEANDVRDAHMHFYVEVFAHHIPRLVGSNRIEALNTLDCEFENIRSMQAHVMACEALEMMIRIASTRHRIMRGIPGNYLLENNEMNQAMQKYLENQPTPMNELQERLFIQLCAERPKDYVEASLWRGLELALKYNNLEKVVHIKQALAGRSMNKNRYHDARQLIEEALSLAYQLQDASLIIGSLLQLVIS